MFPIPALDLWDAAGENIVEHVAAAEVIELKRADADPVILEVELDRMPSRRDSASGRGAGKHPASLQRLRYALGSTHRGRTCDHRHRAKGIESNPHDFSRLAMASSRVSDSINITPCVA